MSDLMRQVAELRSLIKRAYDFWREYDLDHHSKSAEGMVSLIWPSIYVGDWEGEPGVEVYSYVFGPHRTHRFDTIAEARETFQGWFDDYFADFVPCPQSGCAGWVPTYGVWDETPPSACNRCDDVYRELTQ